MIPLLSKFQPRWRSLPFRPPPAGATVAPKVRLSTAPPEPVIPSKKPIKVELVGGKRYAWCSCGHSRKQPFCDGAHKTRAQGMTPLRFVPEKDSTVWLCGCKHTSSPPYCDGTHKQDFIVSAPLHEHAD
ncbi:CDGSH iron-sulfur domain-containing protein 3, mitochondrial [Fundulus heteroclitus]|uniref:CDGSH iron-sulfur domain-containing protein 3, mitochondrial n=1 Tax=Fundulus heteroclitus TaxID=8078 RepID=UPI00165C7D6B|nr:CDGSH iron-sulfur domain-containing protein 3, mitochondrial [Fundulus heteroclitus]